MEPLEDPLHQPDRAVVPRPIKEIADQAAQDQVEQQAMDQQVIGQGRAREPPPQLHRGIAPIQTSGKRAGKVTGLGRSVPIRAKRRAERSLAEGVGPPRRPNLVPGPPAQEAHRWGNPRHWFGHSDPRDRARAVQRTRILSREVLQSFGPRRRPMGAFDGQPEGYHRQRERQGVRVKIREKIG